MNTWEPIAENAKQLPAEKQQQVLELVELLRAQGRPPDAAAVAAGAGDCAGLGERLRVIRRRIEASGEPLLDSEQVLREVAERRGGVAAAVAGDDENLR